MWQLNSRECEGVAEVVPQHAGVWGARVPVRAVNLNHRRQLCGQGSAEMADHKYHLSGHSMKIAINNRFVLWLTDYLLIVKKSQAYYYKAQSESNCKLTVVLQIYGYDT